MHSPRPRGTELTAEEVLAALRTHYLDQQLVTEEWALVTEVPLRAPGGGRRIDVLAVRNWQTRGVCERRAIEIKVSRGDFARDSEAKRAPWQAVVHRFFYATPAGLLRPGEVPEGCGLLEVYGASLKMVKRASLLRRPAPLPDDVVGQLARRVSRADERSRRLARACPEELEATAADVARARAVTAEERAVRETRRRRELEALVAIVLPQECADCGGTIVAVADRTGPARWRHRDAALDASCSPASRLRGRLQPGPVPASLVREDEMGPVVDYSHRS